MSNANNIIIRKAVPADFAGILLLLKEFAQFQKTPQKVTITAEQMQAEKDLFQCMVAESVDGQIVGFITFFPAYYSWSGKAMYVDDLYVTEEYRKRRIGKMLLDTVIQMAKEENCKKVRWQVSHWNINAILFYKSIGALIDDTERNCDLML